MLSTPQDSLPVLIPPHQYCFHTGILSVNRQINSEAADVFYRKNLFVSVTCCCPRLDAKMAGIVVVAAGHHASNFKNYYMEVHIRTQWDSPQGWLPPSREQIIIAGEDVSQLCNLLPGVNLDPLMPWHRRVWPSLSTDVCIQINIKRISDEENAINDFPMAKRLLEPFRRFYGIRVQVEGHVTPSYKESIEQCAARQVPTATDLISMVSKDKEEGNDAKRNGNLDTALKKYEAALNLMRLGCMHITTYPPTSETVAEVDVLLIKLRSLLASAYLEFGEPSKSYCCAQELRLTKSKVNHYCDAGLPVLPDLVHILFCKALAGKTLGQPVQALMDLDVALRISPDDEKMKEERKVLCDLVRERMKNEVQMKWACALGVRSTKMKKVRRSVPAQSVALWKELEALIESKPVA